MRRANSGCARRCHRCRRRGCARTWCSDRRVFPLTVPCPIRSAKFSRTIPIWSSHWRSTRLISMFRRTARASARRSGLPNLIRARIRAETGLTASAGVSYNKFLAKLASDQNKPDGICIIRPGEGTAFVAALSVRRFHGVGPRGAEKMAKLGIATGADLRDKDIAFLRAHFGAQADYLYRAVRGIDLRAVSPRSRAQIAGWRAHFRSRYCQRAGSARGAGQHYRDRLDAGSRRRAPGAARSR